MYHLLSQIITIYSSTGITPFIYAGLRSTSDIQIHQHFYYMFVHDTNI